MKTVGRWITYPIWGALLGGLVGAAYAFITTKSSEAAE